MAKDPAAMFSPPGSVVTYTTASGKVYTFNAEKERYRLQILQWDRKRFYYLGVLTLLLVIALTLIVILAIYLSHNRDCTFISTNAGSLESTDRETERPINNEDHKNAHLESSTFSPQHLVPSDHNKTEVITSYNVTENNPGDKLKMVSRREWLAQPPKNKGMPLRHPLPLVVILHTATEVCGTQAECVFQVRFTQTFHRESKGWDDIGYNFLVGGDASVYVGRGWDTQGAFAYGYNNRSIGIAFIGSFADEAPSQKQVRAGQQLLAHGVELGKLSPDYALVAQRQLFSTQNLGQAFYEEIKTWPHWRERL